VIRVLLKTGKTSDKWILLASEKPKDEKTPIVPLVTQGTTPDRKINTQETYAHK
jgi:hypothetical protein